MVKNIIYDETGTVVTLKPEFNDRDAAGTSIQAEVHLSLSEAAKYFRKPIRDTIAKYYFL